MKLKGILGIIKKGAKYIAGGGIASGVAIFPFDDTLALISGLTSLFGVITGGMAHIIEVWAKATGRIPIDADIDGK